MEIDPKKEWDNLMIRNYLQDMTDKILSNREDDETKEVINDDTSDEVYHSNDQTYSYGSNKTGNDYESEGWEDEDDEDIPDDFYNPMSWDKLPDEKWEEYEDRINGQNDYLENLS